MKTAGLFLSLLLPAAAWAAAGGGRSFDDGWRFHRGDAPDAKDPDFDDSAWRGLDLPHDWSIEDLPPRDQDDIPVLSLRDGEWLQRWGDDSAWSRPGQDEKAWQKVTLPSRWAQHPGFSPEKRICWYRRHVDIAQAADHMVDLSTVMGADEVFFNGERIGSTGKFPPDFEAYWSNVYQRQRSYLIPARLIHEKDTVLAVRVYSENPAVGGLYDALEPVRRTGPFDPGASPGNTDTGHFVGGTGWYRKSFTLTGTELREVSLLFDGIYMDADLWLNGRPLDSHPYGYTSFNVDLTPFLAPPGKTNFLAVRVRNLGRNSRWYSGSGIYRHVWLSIDEPIHVSLWGLSVATPQVSPESAQVKVRTAVDNVPAKERIRAKTRLIAPDGSIAAQGEAEGHTDIEQTFTIAKPRLWSPQTPELYRAQVEILAEGKTSDQAETTFGIRSITVDAEHGLRLNGQTVKLKGACVHHDNGPLGAAAIGRAEERRVEILKANGFNAIRTSHNPPSPAFLEACDRLGMLVMDEAFDHWNQEKNPEDYHRFFKDWWQRDVESMVLRDRNHPSVILWSVGNEIPERKTPEGAATAKLLADFIRSLDPTRPITSAYNEVSETADPYFSALDIAGYNYNPDRYAKDHARAPKRVIVGTESLPDRAFEYWHPVETMPWVIGDFVWTGMDYLGESGLGHTALDNGLSSYLRPWPWHLANSGDIDICGFKKAPSYYRDVLWGSSRLEMTVHRPLPEGRREVIGQWGWPDEQRSWNWAGQEGRPLQVKVYTSYPQVRLLLDGREIGVRDVSTTTAWTGNFETPSLTPETALSADFTVPYAPGELRAVALDQGQPKESFILRTTGRPARLRLTPDRSRIRASRDDLSYVTVEAVDAAGAPVPDAEFPVDFAVSGAGELAAVGSGDPQDVSSFRAPRRKLFHGRALAILRPEGSPGVVTLQASAEGLAPAAVTVSVESAPSKPPRR